MGFCYFRQRSMFAVIFCLVLELLDFVSVKLRSHSYTKNSLNNCSSSTVFHRLHTQQEQKVTAWATIAHTQHRRETGEAVISRPLLGRWAWHARGDSCLDHYRHHVFLLHTAAEFYKHLFLCVCHKSVPLAQFALAVPARAEWPKTITIFTWCRDAS